MSDQLVRHSHRRRRVGGAPGLINVSSYLRDLYQLISLLHADEKVAGVAEFKELSEVNHETEVNRLLIWIATASRQVLDMNMGTRNGSLNNAICGKYWMYTAEIRHTTTCESSSSDRPATSSSMLSKSPLTIPISSTIGAL